MYILWPDRDICITREIYVPRNNGEYCPLFSHLLTPGFLELRMATSNLNEGYGSDSDIDNASRTKVKRLYNSNLRLLVIIQRNMLDHISRSSRVYKECQVNL